MTDKTVAVEILRQLGGNMFVTMTGAKNFVAVENGVQFSIPTRHVNKVRIILDASDTYTIEFFIIRAGEIKPVRNYTGIYNDQLQDVFTEYTGLYTHL